MIIIKLIELKDSSTVNIFNSRDIIDIIREKCGSNLADIIENKYYSCEEISDELCDLEQENEDLEKQVDRLEIENERLSSKIEKLQEKCDTLFENKNNNECEIEENYIPFN